MTSELVEENVQQLRSKTLNVFLVCKVLDFHHSHPRLYCGIN